jgi:hypothetical protein
MLATAVDACPYFLEQRPFDVSFTALPWFTPLGKAAEAKAAKN